MRWEDYDQIQGWPAEGTRVYADTTRIGPRFMDEETREARREASRKWKAANAESNRLRDAERKRGQEDRKSVV